LGRKGVMTLETSLNSSSLLATSFVASAVYHPLTVTKMRYQLGLPVHLDPRLAYRNPKLLIEGVRDSFKGFRVSLITAPLFCAMGKSQEWLKESLPTSDSRVIRECTELSAALIPGLLASPLYNAADVVTIDLQTAKKGEGVFSTMKKVVNQAGLKGLCTGGLALASKDSIWTASIFYGEGKIASGIKAIFPSFSSLNYLQQGAVSGALVGATNWVITQPIDLLATLRQEDYLKQKYPNYFSMVKKTFVEGGLKAFYRGGSPRLIMLIADMAVTVDALKFFQKQTSESAD